MLKIEKDNDFIKVHVGLKDRVFARDPHESINTKEIFDFLENNGYNVEGNFQNNGYTDSSMS